MKQNSLEEHVENCDERYNAVIASLTHLDERLARMEQEFLEIRNLLGNSCCKTTKQLS